MNNKISPSLEFPSFEIHEYSPKSTKYCVCIPVINEGVKIQHQLERMQKISAIADIIIADGGSNDGSLSEEFLKSKGVSCLLIKTGDGKLSAQLRMAYYYAVYLRGYCGVITIDGNNKDNPSSIVDFIEMLEMGFDFIQGSRYLPGGVAKNTPLIRYLAMKFIHIPIISLSSGFRYTDTTNGFRGYSSNLIMNGKLNLFRKVFTTYELLAYISVEAPRQGMKIIEIPVQRCYPSSGKIPTKISLLKGNMQILSILIRAITHSYI